MNCPGTTSSRWDNFIVGFCLGVPFGVFGFIMATSVIVRLTT
jgi:hypothetical protein